MNTLSGVGMGFVGIFVPIYLLQLGFPLSTVILYLMIHHISLLAGAFLSIFISNKIGLVRCWYIRVFLITLLFTGLHFLSVNHSIVFMLGIISGIESAFFWIPYNIFTVRKTDRATMGSSLAFMSNIGSAVGLVIPLVAALIIVSYGYSVLFAVALFFILISLVPVLVLRKERTHFQFSFKSMIDIARKNRHFILPEIFDNLGQDAGVIWALFIFTAGLTVLDLGYLGVMGGIVGIVVTYITGFLIDKWHKQKVIRFGAIFTTLTWIGSYLIAIYLPTPVMLYVVTVLRGFAIGIFAMSYGAVMFNRARSDDAQFIVLREIPTILGRVVVFTASLIFISMGHFELTFIVVGILSLYFWFNNLKVLI
jgi:MFS family permease